MSYNPNSVVVRPLFNEALRGEFNVETSVGKRQLSLSRLVIATVMKALYTFPANDEPVGHYTFVPPYTPKVSVEVYTDKVVGLELMSGIRLSHDSGSFAYISDKTRGRTCLLEIGNKEADDMYLLEMGDPLDVATAAVTREASKIFSK